MIYHEPVLLNETINLLITKKSGFYVDATGGGGGHSKEILKRIIPDGKLIVIDCDPDSIIQLEETLKEFEGYVIFINNNFSNIKSITSNLNIPQLNGVLFDFGVSSHQIDVPSRGFSFMKEGPLDMRMDQRQNPSANEIINNYPLARLEKIIFEYGGEKLGKRIAKQIVLRRPLKSTNDLVNAVKKACPFWNNLSCIARTFQAIRIETNNELHNIKTGLHDAISLLQAGSRIAVLSYHSGEDKIVKNIFKEESSDCICDKRIPSCSCNHAKQIKIITKKPIEASREEISSNSRARSAKLRVAEKI